MSKTERPEGDDPLDLLRQAHVPAPGEAARRRALAAAMAAFEEEDRKGAQGLKGATRPSSGTRRFWRDIMGIRLIGNPAFAGLLVLPVAGYVAWQVFGQSELALPQPPAAEVAPSEVRERSVAEEAAPQADQSFSGGQLPMATPQPAAPAAPNMVQPLQRSVSPKVDGVAEPILPPSTTDGEDRFASNDDNPVRLVAETPVSTFSIDVDTASYSFVRRALNEGRLPERNAVRVEEMINYFPYDWAAPSDPAVPFNTSVSVMPTPWNAGTQLMHIAIKGHELTGERPPANLVFLLDTSGSMQAPDRLPLVKSALAMLVAEMGPQDRISIVAYVGSAGTVLEPTAATERETILAALDRLEAGGSTAGEAGLREAYRLARSAFIEGGVNRVLLATDGDFNVGESSDEGLKQLVEANRGDGVYLSVLGFGRGNFNDALMQTIAQNGNGTASYIDTLSEARKVLVDEASSTLFPIADDVKIQVEFNPARIAEYRLIGYESRALAREDFNNDRVDAGEIGSGHSLTAIYEITPVGSDARLIDDSRYQAPAPTADASDELAFLRLRYKMPGEADSRLIERPVTDADSVASFEAAGEDQRFSVAVAAFGQKLRGTDALAGMDYSQIMEIASAARGADPFGYRSEFLSLVRLASALDGNGLQRR
jgi:Ca-activated chloride channel family protein